MQRWDDQMKSFKHQDVFAADIGMEESTDARRVPSPLNGEKVAEGRMRGGNAHDSGSREDSNPIASVTTPHPALSPLRGEGALTTRSFHVQPQKMTRILNAILQAFILMLGALVITGCSFAPKYSRPAIPTPVAFKELTPEQLKEAGLWKVAEPQDHALRGQWWELFGDAQLNALQERAGASNQAVAAALANFLAARAVVKQARSQWFPTVTTTPSVTRTKQPILRSQAGSSSSTFTEYALPFDATWELDLWGRIRNTVKANKREAEATLADLENVRLTIHAELAADYFQLRALDAEKQLLDAAARAFEESLKLTQARHDTGIASDQDVAQAETQLNTTRAQATDLGIQRAIFEHAIAALIGEPASMFSLTTEPLTNRPIAVPPGIPSQLLERRPDIAAAERRVAEANAQIGVARAAYFPTLTLGGSVGYQSIALENLISYPSFAWSLGATLAQTIFDAGRRRAVTEQAWAIYQGNVANYRQSVLTAFQEVEDNLSTLRLLAVELEQQEAAVNSSRRYAVLANDRYRLGIDSYLNVIVAQTTLLNNQRTAVSLHAQQMVANVQLIKALGGGFDESVSLSKNATARTE
jgi:NodT family efflux transporter outer membrane factor (OMF) lipoprotein